MAKGTGRSADPLYRHIVKDRLLCRFHRGQNRNKRAAFETLFKGHVTFDFGEQSVVRAHSNAFTGEPSGATLTNDDISRNGDLTTKQLYAKTTTCGVATVTG